MKGYGLAALCGLWFLAYTGCGYLVDTERIIVARMDGEPIRREDLNRILREMPDDERPIIQNKGQYLMALNNYIDGRIKNELGSQLRAEGKLQIPRAQAEAVYFEKHPEYKGIKSMADPAAIGYSPEEFEALIQQIEYEIDDIETDLYADASILYAAAQAYREGKIVVEDEDYEQEYRFREKSPTDSITSFEKVSFTAIRFLAALPDANVQAAEVRRRINSGESFESLSEEFRAKDPASYLPSGMENNPASTKFTNAWVTLHGAEVGEIYGPIFLPQYEMVGQRADGTQAIQSFPAAYLVLRVDAHQPEKVLELEDAKPSLLPLVLVGKMMKILRTEHGVEVYPDKLPDPAGYGDQFSEYMI